MATELTELWGIQEEETTQEQTAQVEEEITIEQEEETSDDSEETDEGEDTEQDEDKTAKDSELSAYEKVILDEMERRAGEGDTLLADALKNAGKTIKKCFAYVKEQARKKAVAGCAMIEDSIVFGWAHHYYIESQETIDKEMAPSKVKKAEKTASQKKAEEHKKKVFNNPLLASLAKKGAKIVEGEVAVTKTTTKKDAEGKVLSSKTIKTDADGTQTTTIEKDGQTYTITEFSLF